MPMSTAAPLQVAPAKAAGTPVARGVLQRKLTVGASSDRLEQEADRAADQALAAPPHAATAPAAPRLQREATHATGETSSAPASVERTLARPGTPMAPALRHGMEQRLGHDFSRVRIHTDGEAQQSAHDVSARAYTVGEHITFSAGQFAPDTRQGQRLIAHELAHVVQQGSAAPWVQRELDIEDFDADGFDLPTLQTYLAQHGPGKIEDNMNSDDKARAIVALWRKGTLTLDAAQKILLIQEMQSGFTGNDDERAILTLLLNSSPADIATIFAPKGGIDPDNLDGDFHGAEEDALRAFYDKTFEGGRKAALGGSRALRPAKADEPAVDAPAQADAEVQGPPRQDYVFIMGDVKKDAFYREANRYFRAHRPRATFVTDKRSLAAVLDHVAGEITDPIGNLYLVSHANEDGTLSFGLDGDDKDKKLNVTELRKALHPASGVSALTRVGKQIDAHTVVRIKGCDIGRTKEMLELLDEAFGGAGTVTAPTHEQVYGTDPELAKRADKAFRSEVDAKYPEPAPVDKTLKGQALKDAKAARTKAVAERKAAIKAELKERGDERKQKVQEALTYEAFSGPMFQRLGEQLYTADELLPELKRLYGHLSEARHKALAKKLVAKDPRSNAVALADGTYKQKGQRVYRRVIPRTFVEPADGQEFLAAFRAARGKVPKGFVPGTLSSRASTSEDGEPTRTYRLDGDLPKGATQYFELSSAVVPSDAAFEQTARATLNNPDRYRWDTTRSHNAKKGSTTIKATATRVVAYLHHESLDVSAHEHFNRTEGDSDFFAQSTFKPPPPPK